MRVPRWLLWVAFIGAVAVQLYGLYAPDAPGPDAGIPHFDKVGHFSIFAAVAVTGTWLCFSSWWLGLALVIHAGASEVLQTAFLPHRAGDPADFVTDLIGIAVGLWVGHLTRRMVAPRTSDC
ncbi:VanZ family protein [Rarobacter incanus]|uniref:VanZ family protein n=1 Tax=Rarobacter incanus TaxID=153494 RepID=UPI001B87F62E|nr:VanZ family protein [Rarobacter incanus]